MDGRSHKRARRDATDPGPLEGRTLATPKRLALWQALVTPLIALIVFFALLEGVLALIGVEPALRSEDPFVGFVSNVPLFVEETDSDGRKIITTAKNKLIFFNPQQFPKEKAPETYRIFCLGGSTTYGRPYNDMTSFAGWLRELLPVADSRRRWEVINAGGISYASYRVAHLMEELVLYEPDLFIIYTGHNEFLEKRTYGTLRDIPIPIKTTAALLARTRTWTAMRWLLNSLGTLSGAKRDGRERLSGEVSTRLARSAGPERYKRDDVLRDRILRHYRVSLSRMVDIARSAGADVIFVTPASNLKDATPFKSQHTAGLSIADRRRSEELLSTALVLIRDSAWSQALQILDEALDIDPRFAELHYRRGRVLLALGRYDEAAAAFRRARDEDVCPLRALSSMRQILYDVAQEKTVTLVDFIDLIERRTLTEQGHRIPGEEYFLDHVHPTISGNRTLAVELVQTMIEKGAVAPADTWTEEAIAHVASHVEGRINRKAHAMALVNLAKVLNWAGKTEDAGRLARQALASKVEDPELVMAAAGILARLSEKHGNTNQAQKYYRKALNVAPANPQIHLQIGLLFLNPPLRHLEAAAAHILFASVFWPENDMAYLTFGLAMAERRRYALAYPSLMEALRLNPQNTDAKSALDRLRKMLDPEVLHASPPKVSLARYPSGAPSRIVQVRRDSTGRRYIPDGIWTEWYESGELKRFVDYSRGVPHGLEIEWERGGQVVSRTKYHYGTRIKASGSDSAKGM